MTGIRMLLLIVILSIPSCGQKDLLDGNDSNQMALSVYVDGAGKALVTGYADDINGLDCLRPSHYRYQNETCQIYTITDSLTSKQGNNWTLRFAPGGCYDEYHAKILLPGDAKLRKIVCSPGLEYVIYNSNDSFVAEVLGYDIQDPAAVLNYEMPLVDVPQSSAPAGSSSSSIHHIIVLAAAVIAIAIIHSRRRGFWHSTASRAKPGTQPDSKSVETPHPSQPPEVHSAPGQGGQVVITREMATVIEVLTARERAVLDALIKNGGRMSQSDIRYETGTPGSSLTGIITSLERRNIVTKTEWD